MGHSVTVELPVKDAAEIVEWFLPSVRVMAENPFLIFEEAPQHYVQCLHQAAGWRLEKREGSADSHFVAHVAGSERMMLTDEEVETALIAHLEQTGDPQWLGWWKIDV